MEIDRDMRHPYICFEEILNTEHMRPFREYYDKSRDVESGQLFDKKILILGGSC